MRANKYLLLISSLGVLALLMLAAVQENFFTEWRQIQATARAEAPVPQQLRQVVVPVLGSSDRCVSCHVSMAPGEQGVIGHKVLLAHKSVVHDPSDWGCTICHSGQGRATTKADAHGEVHFWPEPMIPARFSYAGCGTCHTPLGVPESEQLRTANAVFERLDCRTCHRVDGVGGTLRPDGRGMEGPDLSRIGVAGYDQGWYARHLARSGPAATGAWRDGFRAIAPADLSQVDVYLRTRVAAPSLVEAKAAFFSAGCLGCHKVSGVGGDEGPDLSRAGEKDPGQVNLAAAGKDARFEHWLAEHFRSPAAVVANSQMPNVPLSEAEIERLTMYTLSLRRRVLPDKFVPRDRLRSLRFGEREFATDGATLFGAFCAGCHGADGQGRRAPGMAAFPSIANPDLLARVSDDFLLATIRKGRPGRRMPAWASDAGLKPAEMRAVIAHLRGLARSPAPPPDPRPRWIAADAQAGSQIFHATCAGCHGDKGQGGEGPALNNAVLLGSATDSYLFATIANGRRGTTMDGFSAPSVVRRTLTPAEIEAVVAYIRTWEKKP